MRITDIFIHRPVLALVVNILIVIAGVQAISGLSVRQYPRSENAVVTVRTVYVGASPELVRGFVTTVLERAIAAADGIDYIESQSSQNLSLIQARLKLNYDPIKALSDISSKVDQVRGDLPPEAEVPVLSVESADTQFASAYLSFTSDTLERNQVTDYLVRVVQPRLSALPGVQRAEILGPRIFAMRIWLDPDRMTALGVSPTDVRAALETRNALAAVGQTKGNLVQVNLAATTDLQSVREFEELVVRDAGDRLVRLRDIAQVVLGAEDYDAEVRFSGQEAVFMGIWPLPTANSLDVIDGVRREMADIEKSLPQGMSARIAYDATDYIRTAIHEVLVALGQTLGIVVVVVYLFLGRLRSALVPAVTIPLSLVGAVFLMSLMGFTINLLTLLALVLCVGLVVDDAIVVVEDVERHVRLGKSPQEAALTAGRELAVALVATTVVLVAVYAPIGLQGGLTGSLFREFALTLSGAVCVSTVTAITLSPVMSSWLLSGGHLDRPFSRRISQGFARFEAAYARVLSRVVERRAGMYVLWLALSVACVPLFVLAPKELAPAEDQGVIFGILDAPADASLDQTSRFAQAVNEVFFSVPEAQFTFQVTFPSSGFSGLVLRPWEERQRTVFEILPQVQQGLSAIPGIQMFAVSPPPLPGGGDFPVEFIIASTEEQDRVLELATELQQRATASGLFAFPPLIDVKMDQPTARLVLDRDKIAALGLSLAQVASDVAVMTGGNYVNRFSMQGRSYKVIPQVQRVDRLTPEQLGRIHLRTPQGLVPLSAVAHVEYSAGPRSLNRFQQLNAVKLSGVPMRPLDEALTFLENEAGQILPKGYVIDYKGDSRQLRTEGNRFVPAMALAVICAFLVLAAQYESFRDPLIILAGSAPLGLFGALIFTFLKIPDPSVPFWTDHFTTTLNIYSQVGLVTLVGLVAKNGILLVEFANQLQDEGKGKLEAILEAARTRLRPIVMTSASTVAGFLPLVVASGAGAAARFSIGIVLVGGMVIGTICSLFFVPCIYMLLARVRRPQSTEVLPLFLESATRHP
ncbi:acriflavine resistance protein B [Thermodesulfomicrobium sp. WS]|uniref:efflux RND transporter permease subunit n=1 Tax=Thermodesulfomicrobium sp. WS TaxID=3004129 RepID=UPI0024900CDE|nr:efflux RND transporter permease subunit [Thermodesulfomicrobium sp. WS]BDV00173.1 acriflavine resistance protein B [Thermodesulfomicrobium sp. WS]